MVLGLLIAIVVIAAMIAPWTIRNYRAFGRFVLLNTNAGFAFFWANHPIHGRDFMAIFPEGISYQGLIPHDLRALDEAALDAALLRQGLRFVMDAPARYLVLSLSRVKDYFKFWPSAESGLISNIARVLSFGLYLPFMVYGLVLSIVRGPFSRVRDLRHSQLNALDSGLRTCDLRLETWNLGLLYLFIGVYTAIHLLSWALICYRLPVDAVLIIFAGWAVVDIKNRLG